MSRWLAMDMSKLEIVRGARSRAVVVASLLVGLALVTFSLPRILTAAEFHSNGVGGGDWSDPGSWREKMVPTAEDDAVISRGDTILFDRNDEDKTSCKQIFIDPKGTFGFKPGCGRIVCCIAGAIESYGTVKIDGSRSATDKFELRFVGSTAVERSLKLLKGGALIVNGRKNLAHGRHNVTITSGVSGEKMPIEAEVSAIATTMVDVQRAEVFGVHFTANGIDNTGAKASERINIIDNHFTGLGHISLTYCDSPVIAGNLFEAAGVVVSRINAIYALLCSLAEIRGNTVRGYYGFGVHARQMVDGALTDSTFDGCSGGVYWYGTNGMLKGLTMRNCNLGITCTSMSGVLEDIVIDNCKTSYNHTGATAQLTNVQIVNVPKEGKDIAVVAYTSGPLTLLNCNIGQDQIKLMGKAPLKVKEGTTVVESLAYIVAKPVGKIPPGAFVEVRTANPKSELPPGAADLNVRNSPAKILSNGMTPFPGTLEPLIVKSWAIDDELKPVAAPKYKLSVLAPAAAAGQQPRTLATMEVTPDDSWYRELPNADKPTVEIKVP